MEIWNVACHHCIGANHCSAANPDTRENAGSHSNEGSITNLNRSLYSINVTPHLVIYPQAIDWVTCINDRTEASYGYVRPDANTVTANNMYILFYIDIVTDCYMGYRRERISDDFHPQSMADNGPAPYAYTTWVHQKQGWIQNGSFAE
ncbi:hypothetical protein [Granulicella sp. WH15]|uniref:hypothetical protein n=1 Tax=Granulicella sp. WH15 TaxID=2602070 RepID=UPI0023DDE79C|nr:hypothetical protein [Granulicella sp. WH15]